MTEKSSFPSGFVKFLHQAKRETYAGSGGNCAMLNPAFPESTELEYRSGDWLYRDVYFGQIRFSGLEFVYHHAKPVWSMAYSGGVKAGLEAETVRLVYGFLRTALLKAPSAFPIRGVPELTSQAMRYQMQTKGDLTAFSGQEQIHANDRLAYCLDFAGGLVR